MRWRWPANTWRCLCCALALALLAGCVGTPARNPLATWVPSPNVDARRAVLIVSATMLQCSHDRLIYLNTYLII